MRADVPTVAAASLAAAGPVVTIAGALAAAGEEALVLQTPYLVSSGATGVALTATGAVLLAVLRRRRATAARVDALEGLTRSCLTGGPRAR